MKTKLLLGLALLVTLGMTSCKKDKDEEPTSVKIGNKDYAIVTIGNQLWTASNYEGEGGMYYRENGANKNVYGKYYTLAEAKAITVPAGWRLPTKDDYKKLLVDLGAEINEEGPNSGFSFSTTIINKLISKTEWQVNVGTNTTGFNAFPAGSILFGDEYDEQQLAAGFWTSTTYGEDSDPIYFYIRLSEGNVTYASYGGNGDMSHFRYSVRFVKDK